MAYKYEKLECASLHDVFKCVFAGEAIFFKCITGYDRIIAQRSSSSSFELTTGYGNKLSDDCLGDIYTRHEVEWWEDLPEGEFLVTSHDTKIVRKVTNFTDGETQIDGNKCDIQTLAQYYSPTTKEEALRMVLPQEGEE